MHLHSHTVTRRVLGERPVLLPRSPATSLVEAHAYAERAALTLGLSISLRAQGRRLHTRGHASAIPRPTPPLSPACACASSHLAAVLRAPLGVRRECEHVAGLVVQVVPLEQLEDLLSARGRHGARAEVKVWRGAAAAGGAGLPSKVPRRVGQGASEGRSGGSGGAGRVRGRSARRGSHGGGDADEATLIGESSAATCGGRARVRRRLSCARGSARTLVPPPCASRALRPTHSARQCPWL